MNTHAHKYSWLRRSVLMLIVMTGSLSIMAQDEIEGGEAFYIYQNDGNFNGFFYDQVQQISYSRLDTLGVEHDDYVSQEIITADSTYRIMLTAIDSVSFVQPEIKFAKGVRFMRDEGMMDYFVRYIKDEATGHILEFSSSMPEALRPRKDDVLTCTDLEGYDGAFVYKVTEITEEGGLIHVICDYVNDFNEVFEQFITVEQVQEVQSPEGNVTSRRRMAGLNAPKRIEGNYNLNLFNINRDFENNFYFAGGLADDHVGLKLGLKLHLGFGMSANLAYKIQWGDFFLHCELREMLEVGLNATVDGSLSGEKSLKDIPLLGDLLKHFTRIPFPAQMPLLNLKVVPEPIIRGELHFVGGFNTGITAKFLKQSFTLRSNPKEERGEKYLDMTLLAEPGDRVSTDPPSLYLEINGMVQAGVKFPILVEENDWMGNFLSFTLGYTVFAGPKLSGNLTFDVLKGTEDPYSALNKTKVSGYWYSVDGEAVAKTAWWKDHVHEKKWTQSLNMYGFDANLFPSISDMTYEVTGNEMNQIKAHFYTNGETCWPQYLGVALYSKENDDDEKFTKLYKEGMKYEEYFLNTYNDAEMEIHGIDGGDYMLRPVIKLKGFDTLIPIYDMEQPVHIGRTDLLLEPEVLTVEDEGGEFQVTLHTGHPLPVQVLPGSDWVKAKVNYVTDSNGTWARSITITVDENNDLRFRTDSVSVWMVHNETETIEKKLLIRQYGGLQIDPSELTFETDGGEEIVNILSSYSPITIDLKEGKNWLYEYYDEEDRTLSLTAKPNTGAERKATVIVAGWSKRYEGISQVELKVTQKGLVDVVLDKEELAYEANGGTQTVNVTIGSDGVPAKYEFTDITVDDDDKNWIFVEKLSNTFNVTVPPNPTVEERVSYIYANFTKKNSNDSGPETYQIAVKITQKASTASVSDEELRFEAKGGKLTTKIDFGIFPYCGAYFNEVDPKWAKFSVGDDGTVTVTAEENPSALERECILVCYVSGKEDPKDEEMLKMPVRIVQDGMTIIPDGNESPFNYINFWTSRKVQYIAEESETDTIVVMNSAFNFKPDYSHFTLKEEKGIIHITCEGFLDTPGETQSSKATGVLSFDIDKAKETIRNLKFNLNAESILNMHLLPFTDTHTVINSVTQMTLSEFPLRTFSSTYKEGKYSVADGLTFDSFSSTADMRTTYTLSPPLDPNDNPGPINEYVAYIPIGDSEDYVWLIISMKETETALEWPTDEVMQSLKDGGMPINDGGTPPTLDGTYSLSPISVVADKIGALEEMDGITGMVIKFNGQDSGKLDVDFYFTADGEADMANGAEKALIKGNGNSFTICVPLSDGSFIISGTMSDGAVSNLYLASTSKDVPNQYIILKDNDGNSSKTTWSPAPDDDE